MAVICPTVTAADPQEFRSQIETAAALTKRVHLDFSDGVFAPRQLVNVAQAWWPSTVETVDFHLMLQKPMEHLETVISLHPTLAIVHAEAEDAKEFLLGLDSLGIKKGIAILQDTPVEAVKNMLDLLSHILIFSGDLGHFGGSADVGLLSKVWEIKRLKPDIEVGWDGGINDKNARQLASGGVDVLNVGGFIQKSEQPKEAFHSLQNLAG